MKPEYVCHHVCTPETRAPDIFLGNSSFGTDLDMWSLGCVAAEMFLRSPLFCPNVGMIDGTVSAAILKAQAEFLGTPADGLTSLPFWQHYMVTLNLPKTRNNALRGCPPELSDFVEQTLKWNPQERMTAASALQHSFVLPPALSVIVSFQKGKNGPGSIAAGCVDDDVLEYLQGCTAWPTWVDECEKHNFSKSSKSVSEEEGDLGLKGEFAGYIDANNPPKCRRLNGDKNIPLTKSERLAHFAKALRVCLKPWLQQLTERCRKEIRRQRLPKEFLESNGTVFMEEDFADNAFVYASTQIMKVGKREDGWHNDGGTSLLHAALTLFGKRDMQVELESGCISLSQRPGSFYMGNLCALKHCVVHGDDAAGCYMRKESEPVEIAVMLRSDLFREGRARSKNSTPGPKELYDIVNAETAKHLAEVPIYLPDLAQVIAKQRWSGS